MGRLLSYFKIFLEIFIFLCFGEGLKLKNHGILLEHMSRKYPIFSLQPLTKPSKNENFQKIQKYLKRTSMDYTYLNF